MYSGNIKCYKQFQGAQLLSIKVYLQYVSIFIQLSLYIL